MNLNCINNFNIRHEPLYLFFVNIIGIPKTYAFFLTLLGSHKGPMMTLQGRKM